MHQTRNQRLLKRKTNLCNSLPYGSWRSQGGEKTMADPAVIRIFDTTLRDGEQSPGATMSTVEKIQVAEQLVRLNVDIIEAGFPAASPGDLAAVKEIARRTHGVAIAGLARTNKSDIDDAWEAVCEADQPVIHVFLAT